MEHENNITIDEWNRLVGEIDGPQSTFQDYVNVDDEVQISGLLTEDEIISNNNNNLVEQEDDVEEDEQCEVNFHEKVTKNDAENALATLHKFFEVSHCDRTAFDKIYDLEAMVDKTSAFAQKKLTDYFNKI